MWNWKCTASVGILLTVLAISTTPLNAAQASPTPSQDAPAVQLCRTGFSPDGKTITTSTDDGHVRLWDTESTKLLHDFVMNKGCIDAVFTPDSQRLFTSWPGSNMIGKDALTILWDVQTDKEIRRFKEKNTVSDDGQLVLTISGPPEKLWDAASGGLVRTFSQSLHAIPGGFFSPDNQRFISVNFPVNQAELWNLKLDSLIFTFPQENAGWISLIRFLPDNEHVLIGNYNNDVALWNLNSLTVEHTFEGTGNMSRFNFFTSDGDFFMVALDSDGMVRVWNVQTGDLPTSFTTQIPREYVSDNAVSSDGKHLLIGLDGGISQLWNMETGTMARQYFPRANSNITQWNDARTFVKFSPDSGKILLGYSNEPLHLWDLKTGAEQVYGEGLP